MKRVIFYQDWEMRAIEHLVLYRILFTLILINCIWAQKLPDQQLDKNLSEGINLIINQDYKEALQKFTLLKTKYPDNPLGNIYSAVVLITENLDLGQEFNDSLITIYFDESAEQISKLPEVDDQVIWNYYYLAILNGYRSYFSVLKKEYLLALSYGLSSIEYFEKCISEDSTFYESYIAIGTFKYWKSEKTEFLNWLPFYTDEKETGINLIKKGLKSPSYNYYLGLNSLIWIYINQNNYENAIILCNEALKNYPENRSFKWCLADAYEYTDKKKAISEYNELLSSYLSMNDNNHYHEIILKHIIAKLYSEIGNDSLALKQCDEILSINSIQKEIFNKLEKRLENVKKLQMKLKDNNKPLKDK